MADKGKLPVRGGRTATHNKRRLKSTSKDGQSLKARAGESKGKRNKELDKLSKVDKANYKKAPKAVQKKIKASYTKKTKAKTKNKGKYL